MITLRYKNTKKSLKKLDAEINKYEGRGYRVVHRNVIPGEWNGGKGCCLFMIFPPLILFAKARSQVEVTLEEKEVKKAQGI